MTHSIDQALALMVGTFQRYARKDGDKKFLSKGEMKELIQNEMSIGPKLNDAEIKGLMEDLDQNHDHKMSFPEFMTFMGAMAMILNQKVENC